MIGKVYVFSIKLAKILWGDQEGGLAHSTLTAKQVVFIFYNIFMLIFQFLRPNHDCYVKFTSFLT